MTTVRTPLVVAALFSVVLSACTTLTANASPAGTRTANASTASAPARPSAPITAAARVATATDSSTSGGLRVLVEPQAGLGPIYGLITGAKTSIDLTMYELRDQTAEADLTAAAARGVDVRVILDQHLERSRNTAAYNYLAARRVHVVWAPATTTYHEKALTVDGVTSVVMTLNLVSEDYPDTRDFAVIDTRAADVAAIQATFDADFDHRTIDPPDGSDLVWSPTNSTASILATIRGATRTLSIENEEMSDPVIVDALEAAARRGVDVQVTMTADSAYDHDFAQLAGAGVHVRTYPDSYEALYIHAKAIVADSGRADRRALVGSQNFSVASLDYNRELGILTTNPLAVATVANTLTSDFDGATAYGSG